MDIQAVLEKLKNNPDLVRNAEYYRELIDKSEATDSDELKEFVKTLVTGNQSGEDAV